MSKTENEKPRLIVLCDGTWCGPETETRTNIHILAELVGIDMTNPRGKRELNDTRRNIKAKYFSGIGSDSTFLSYLFNGATANNIGQTCIDAYQYIAENFTQDTEIWMFGLSRGAYTVRCVVGMINNCGIVKNATNDLCNTVYKIYSSPYQKDEPGSAQSKDFRAEASWKVDTPVKFMGLLDTVGSIGIPSLNAGNGPTYPTLWSQVVSSSVEHVYHACSLHDRLSLFQPCLTKEDPGKHGPPYVHERWFPGCHYDLGRQRFRFLRQEATNIPERLLSFIPNLFSGALEPNQVLSDLVLHWLLEAIHHEMHEQNVICHIEREIHDLDVSIRTVSNGIGSGDVYSPEKGLVYAPFGKILALLPPSFLLKDAFKILLAIRDRRIPDVAAKVFPYKEPYGHGALSIAQLAQVDARKYPDRYPSRTYESWLTWRDLTVAKTCTARNGGLKAITNGDAHEVKNETRKDSLNGSMQDFTNGNGKENLVGGGGQIAKRP